MAFGLSRRELHIGQRPGDGARVEVAGLDGEMERGRDGAGLSVEPWAPLSPGGRAAGRPRCSRPRVHPQSSPDIHKRTLGPAQNAEVAAVEHRTLPAAPVHPQLEGGGARARA